MSFSIYTNQNWNCSKSVLFNKFYLFRKIDIKRWIHMREGRFSIVEKQHEKREQGTWKMEEMDTYEGRKIQHS